MLIPATEADAIDGDVLMEFVNICKDRQRQNQLQKPATVLICGQLSGECGSRGSTAGNVCCLWPTSVRGIGNNGTRILMSKLPPFRLCGVLLCFSFNALQLKESEVFSLHLTLKVAAFDLTEALLWDYVWTQGISKRKKKKHFSS